MRVTEDTSTMLLLAGLFLLASAAVPAAVDPGIPRLQVIIDIESGVELAADDVREIAAGVRRIWRNHADVVVTSRDDLRSGAGGDGLTLVITNRILRDTDSSGLGWIEFVNGTPQTTITISMAAVRGLIKYGAWRGRPFDQLPPIAARYFMRRAIMRATAHEVGHYLLKSRDHAPSGLMRARFTIDEIMDGRPQLERIDPADADRLQYLSRNLDRASGRPPS